jgi:hypothetical protein
MAQFCIEIADADVGRVIVAVCANYGYRAVIDNPDFDSLLPEDPSTNPKEIANSEESPFQFANRQTRAFLSENTVAYEAQQAKAALSVPSGPDISDPQ